MPGPDVLPGQEETHVLLCAHRLDRTAGAGAHRSVDARKQVPRTEALSGQGRRRLAACRDTAAEHRTFRFQAGNRRTQLANGADADRGRQLLERDRPERPEMATRRGDERFLTRAGNRP